MSYLEVALLCVVVLGVSAVIAGWVFKQDTEAEDRKRGAVKLSSTLSGLGLVKIPEFLMDYAVNDWSGMAKKMSDLGRLLLASGDDVVLREFEKVLDRLLTARLSSDVGRAYVSAKLSDAVKASDPSVVKDAPKAGIVS